MFKKIFAIIMIITMIFATLTSCIDSSTSKDTSDKTETSKTDKKTATTNFNKTGYPIVNEKITLTCMHSQNPGHGNFNDMAYFKKMEEVTNIHMDFIAVPTSDWDTKKNLTLASGDLPHWFYSKLSVNDLQKYGVEGGSFVDVSGLIKEYMPNLVKTFALYPTAERIIAMLDGSVYCMPHIVDDATCAGDTLYLRMDFLKEVGIKEKPKTIEEFYNMLVAFKESNFSEDFSPLLPAGGMGAVEGFLFPSFGEGWDPGFADNGDGVVVYNAISEQYRRYLEFVNKLFTEKLLENEVYTMDWATAAAKTKSNKGAVITAGTSLTLDNFKSGEYEVELFPPLTSEYTQEIKIRRYNSVSMSGGTITKRCSDDKVKALLRWMDINYSEEDVAPGLNRLSQWLGIRGETFDLLGENKEFWTILAPKDTSLSEYEWTTKYAAPGGWIAALVTTAIPYNNPAQEMKATQSLKNLYPYMRDSFPDSFLKYSAEDQDVIANKLTDIQTYVNQMNAKFVTGAEPLSKWDDFVKEVEKMGIKDVLAIKQKAYDAFLGK